MTTTTRNATLLLTLGLGLGCGDPTGDALGTDTDTDTGTDTLATTDTMSNSGTTGDPENPPNTSDTTEGPVTETETTGGPEMACEGSCVPPAPEGWSGPVARIALADGADKDSACGGSFPELAATGFSTLDPPTSDCSCSCGEPMGGACDPDIDVDVFDAQCNSIGAGGACLTPGANLTGCSSVDETLSIGSEDFLDSDRFGIRVIADPPTVASAPSCAPSDDSVLSPPVPRDDVELCTGPAPAGACVGDEVCSARFLNPFDAGACIWIEGESDCPESDYNEQTLLHESVVDTRECSACSCGAGTNASCAGAIEVRATYGVNGVLTVDPPEIVAADSDCSILITPNTTPFAAVNFTISYDPQTPTSSSCQPSGGNLTGEVTATGVRTVCCQPS